MTRTYSKICGRCGQSFQCGLSRCWCVAIPVSDQLYADIVNRFDDCLCSACLSELIGTTADSGISDGQSSRGAN